MGGNEKKRNLEVEELENRVAPITVVYSDPVEPDPTAPGTGGDPSATPDQPGNSDLHRQREFKQQV